MAAVPFPGDTYETPSGQATPLASRFPSLSFYWMVLGVIRHDGKLASADKYHNKEWVEGSCNTLRALERCGITVTVEGMDAMDRAKGPCVFIANHMSTLETFVLPVFIQPRKTATFVVKEELLKYPWFGPVLGSRDPIAVGRVNPRQDLAAVLEGGEKRLRNGISIIIFPQSKRSVAFDRSAFNSIGVKLARRAEVPVIPIALRTDAWGMGKIIKDFGPINASLPVRFAFGEPFFVNGNGKEEHAQVCDFIADRLRAWGIPEPASRN